MLSVSAFICGILMKLGDLLFVYGTLRLKGSRHSVLSSGVRFVQEDLLKRARIYEITNGSFPFPGLKLSDSSVDAVVGDVLKITDPSLPAILDRYEGYPYLYSQSQFMTEGGHNCWVYTYNGDVTNESLIHQGDWLNQ